MIAEVLSDCPSVKWVQSTWAGVKPLIDHPRRDYMLTSIKDVFGAQIAEYVFGYLLAHELKLQQRLAKQQNRTWYKQQSGTLHGKRLGIMGTGTTGRYVASIGRQFGMTPVGSIGRINALLHDAHDHWKAV